MENLKKNVDRVNSGQAQHPLAPDLKSVEQTVQHFNSGVARLQHHKKQ